MNDSQVVWLLAEEEIFTNGCIIVCLESNKKQCVKKHEAKAKQFWPRPQLLCHPQQGYYDQLMKELAIEDPMGFQNFRG